MSGFRTLFYKEILRFWKVATQTVAAPVVTALLYMLVFVVAYALVAMALAQARPLQEAPALVQSLGYVILGLAWTLPLMPLVKWMERPDRRS